VDDDPKASPLTYDLNVDECVDRYAVVAFYNPTSTSISASDAQVVGRSISLSSDNSDYATPETPEEQSSSTQLVMGLLSSCLIIISF